MNKLLLSAALLGVLLCAGPALALDTGLASSSSHGGGHRMGGMGGMGQKKALAMMMQKQSAAATPFGGAHSMSREGKRPEELQRPSASMCALRGQSGHATGKTQQDASGRVKIANDASSLKGRSIDIYSSCAPSAPMAKSGKSGTLAATGGAGLPGLSAASQLLAKTKPPSSFDSRTNMLKTSTATTAYVPVAGSSLGPKKSDSLYDPLTGGLKPPKVLSAYGIYQKALDQ